MKPEEFNSMKVKFLNDLSDQIRELDNKEKSLRLTLLEVNQEKKSLKKLYKKEMKISSAKSILHGIDHVLFQNEITQFWIGIAIVVLIVVVIFRIAAK